MVPQITPREKKTACCRQQIVGDTGPLEKTYALACRESCEPACTLYPGGLIGAMQIPLGNIPPQLSFFWAEVLLNLADLAFSTSYVVKDRYQTEAQCP